MHVDLHLSAPSPAEREALSNLLGSRLPLRMREDPSAPIDPAATVWVHGEPPRDAELESLADRLAEHVEAGGRALLTGAAVELVTELLDTEVAAVGGPEVGRALTGIAAMPGEPLFHRAPGGVDLVGAAADGVQYCWEHGDLPPGATVLGVLRRSAPATGEVQFDADQAVLVEFRIGAGRLLALGLTLEFVDDDPFLTERRARFLGDLFDYLQSDSAAEQAIGWLAPDAGAGTAWLAASGESAPMVALPEDLPAEDDPLWRTLDLDPEAAAADLPQLVLTARDGQVAHLRADGVIESVWCRSFRAARDLTLFFESQGIEAVRPVRTRVHPRAVHVELSSGGSVWLRRPSEGGGFTLRVEATAAAPLDVTLEGALDLDPAWPYPAGGGCGARTASSARHGAALTFSGERFDALAGVVSDLRPTRAWSRDDGEALAFGRSFTVPAGDSLTVTLGGRGEFGPSAAPGEAASGPAPSFGIATGDPEVDRAMSLALARLADFEHREAPGSRRLLARRAASAGEPVDLRIRRGLGVAACLAAFGGRDRLADELRGAAASADPDGRIASRAVPTGATFHHGPEATPAFVDALGSWVAWTGDLELVRELWPAACAALDWMERFDPLEDAAMVHTVALSIRAWSVAMDLADRLGDPALASRVRERLDALRTALRERFWIVDDGSYALRAGGDGERDEVSATLCAVPWALGLGEHGSESAALRRYATPTHQTDWGVRGWPADEPRYDPETLGAVTPDATAVAALADLLNGRPDSAWPRCRMLAAGLEDFAPGHGAAALHGARYARIDAAATDLAATGALMTTLLRGLLGFRVLAEEPRVVFEPTLPGALDRLDFEGVTLGDSTVSGHLARGSDGAGLELRLVVAGAPLSLAVAPFVPGPAVCERTTLDGAPLDPVLEEVGEGVRIRVHADLEPGEHLLAFDVTPDVLVGFAPDSARPGAESEGPRYLGRRLQGDGSVALDLELREPCDLQLRTPGRALASVDGAERIGAQTLRITPGPGAGYRRTTARLHFEADAGS